MIRALFAAALCCVLFSGGAEARHWHSNLQGNLAGCSDPVMRPCGPGFENGIFGEGISRKPLRRRHFHGNSRLKEITRRGHHLKALKRLVFRSKSDDLGITPENSMLISSTSFEAAKINMARPARYIAGRLVCAVNVNAELARRGIRGTGSAQAKSFLRWGRASRPVEGAVAVYGRKGGGHVAIVSRVVGGRVWVWNPSSRAHRWREVEYRKRAIAYRVAGW